MSVTEGHVENVDVVSTYIPIGEPGRIRAVFELYSDVTDAVAKVQQDALRLVTFLGAVFATLYGALLLIVSRGDRILQRQFRQLEDERLSRLKRFFSPQVAELIDSGGMDDPLQTHRREITAVSIDLRGFTAFTESAEPEEVMGLLREYHDEIGKVILEHQGTIEYFCRRRHHGHLQRPRPGSRRGDSSRAHGDRDACGLRGAGGSLARARPRSRPRRGHRDGLRDHRRDRLRGQA
jgi:hypothetical protein